MMPLCQPPLRFSSRIQFVSKAEFDRIASEMKKVGESEVQTLRGAGCTKDILMCNAGGVTSQRQQKWWFFIKPKMALFHLYEIYELPRLQKAMDTLKPQNATLRGLFVGGISSYGFSMKLRDSLKQYLESLQIPFSMFWGHTGINGRTHIAYSPQKDTWYMWTLYNKTNKRVAEVSSLEDLKAAFEEIQLSTGDEVVIGNKTYQGEEVNQLLPPSR